MPKRVISKAEKDHFIAFILANRDTMSTKALAAALGISDQTVATWLMKMGIKKKYIGERRGMFKKGRVSSRDGRSYIRKNERGVMALWTRGEVHQLSHLVWEEKNGPVPKGMVITFKDNNPGNLDISNLELITRRQLLDRHTVHRYGKEVVGLIQISANLKRKINEQSKNGKGGAVQATDSTQSA